MAHKVSFEEYDETCVQSTVQPSRMRLPGAGALASDDARARQWIAPLELQPWQARFDFLVYCEEDTESGELRRTKDGKPLYEYVPIGHELERRVSIEEAENSPEEIRLASQRVRRLFTEGVARYTLIAELVLRFQLKDATELHRRRLHLDPETVAYVWRSLRESPSRTYDMMEIFGVKSRTTITAAVRRSVDAGALAESDLTGRNRPRLHWLSYSSSPRR